MQCHKEVQKLAFYKKAALLNSEHLPIMKKKSLASVSVRFSEVPLYKEIMRMT